MRLHQIKHRFNNWLKACARPAAHPLLEPLEPRQLLSAAPLTLGSASVGQTAQTGNVIAVGADEHGLPIVDAYSAITGQLLWSNVVFPRNFDGGVRVAAGYLDATGTPYVVAAPAHRGYPLIDVFNGYTGQLVHQFYAFDGPHFFGGVNLAVGDFTGSGHGDIIVGAAAGGQPVVNVYDGESTTLLTSFDAFNYRFAGGVRVAAGDIQANGHADIIAGAGFGGLPLVNVFSYTPNVSLADPVTTVESFMAYAPAFPGGVFVAAGKVTGTGLEDIVTGAGFGGGPDVRVFEGLGNPQVVQEFFAYDASFTASVRVAVTDVTGSGVDDIITTPGPGILHNLKEFTGTNGHGVLNKFHPFGAGWLGGEFVAASGSS